MCVRVEKSRKMEVNRSFNRLHRVWSKKYPIKVTTNMRKPCSEDQDTSKEVVPTTPPQQPVDPAEANADTDNSRVEMSVSNVDIKTFGHLDDNHESQQPNGQDEDEVMHDARDGTDEDPDDSFEILQERSRSFYLFARTSREKEEWFNSFLVGAKFMQDWNHQNPPKERTLRPDPNYQTYKEKEQRFKMFMENYFQVG